MARLTAPLLSLSASGTIAKTLTFANWKGIPYVRTRVIPANPKSDAQKEVRGIFSTLNLMWKRMPSIAREPFIAAVRGLPLTPRNKHIQANVATLIDETTLDNLVMSIAGGSAVIPDTVDESVATPLHIIVTAVAPTTPSGYTLTAIQVAAVLTGDPSPALDTITYADEDLETPYSIDLTVPAAGTYQVGTWTKWERTADEKVFYSAAVRDQAIVAAE